MSLFEKHQATINKAIDALHARTFYAAFPEHPAPAIYGETADADGQNKFKSVLGKKFEELKQQDPAGWVGQEESPYFQDALKISYPIFSVPTLIDRASKAFHPCRKTSASERAGIYFLKLPTPRCTQPARGIRWPFKPRGHTQQTVPWKLLQRDTKSCIDFHPKPCGTNRWESSIFNLTKNGGLCPKEFPL